MIEEALPDFVALPGSVAIHPNLPRRRLTLFENFRRTETERAPRQQPHGIVTEASSLVVVGGSRPERIELTVDHRGVLSQSVNRARKVIRLSESRHVSS